MKHLEVNNRNNATVNSGTRRFIAPITAMLLCASASASAAPLVAATHYECTGRNTSVRYSTTGLDGEPSILIRIGKVFIKRSGAEIRTQSTMLGSLVTILRESVPDSHVDTLTLLAPDVNVPVVPIKAPTEFMTTLFSTRILTTIGGPSLVPGVIQDSSPQPLLCKATTSSSQATE